MRERQRERERNLTDSEIHVGSSLVVQWLKLCVSPVGGRGSLPSQGTKILCAMQQGQINKLKLKEKENACEMTNTQEQPGKLHDGRQRGEACPANILTYQAPGIRAGYSWARLGLSGTKRACICARGWHTTEATSGVKRKAGCSLNWGRDFSHSQKYMINGLKAQCEKQVFHLKTNLSGTHIHLAQLIHFNCQDFLSAVLTSMSSDS